MGDVKFIARADGRMGVVETLGEAAAETVADDIAMPTPPGPATASVLRRRLDRLSRVFDHVATGFDVVAAAAIGVLGGVAALAVRPDDMPFVLAIGFAACAVAWDFFLSRRLEGVRSELARTKGWQAAEQRLNARHRSFAQAEIADLHKQLAAARRDGGTA